MSDKKDSSKPPRETNGPVVKSGPTSGQNRSRNQTGEWRQKRSDAGTTKKKSGCFLTTAACEHMGRKDDCKELETLREFRDGYLSQCPDGKALIEHYYEIAPRISQALAKQDLDHVWKIVLKCVNLISERRLEEAKHEYVQMVERLEATTRARTLT